VIANDAYEYPVHARTKEYIIEPQHASKRSRDSPRTFQLGSDDGTLKS
jgi:hypothetical protein